MYVYGLDKPHNSPVLNTGNFHLLHYAMYVVWISVYFHDILDSLVDIAILTKNTRRQVSRRRKCQKDTKIKEILASRFLCGNILSYRH